jgi:hypothetical protein
VLAATCWWGAPAAAFFANGRWESTALDPVATPRGSGPRITWSLVPDGTAIPGTGASNLIGFLDALFGVANPPAALTERPWFPRLQQSMDRWSMLGGATFVYEPFDDGTPLRGLAGAANVRGDVRLGGTTVDGPGGANGSTGFLPDGDITFDTSDRLFFGNASSDYLNLRNFVMHEAGHALGLGHIDSNTAEFLMEPFSRTTFDGPQIDDVRGLHQLYGDAWEKRTPNAQPNNDLSRATPLGPLLEGTSRTLGADGDRGAFVPADAREFASIAGQNDSDYFTFQVAAPVAFQASLRPVGPNYAERTGSGPYALTKSAAQARLQLALYDATAVEPIVLRTASAAALGETVEWTSVTLWRPGSYALRVSTDAEAVQLYRLTLHATTAPEPEPGDFNRDGRVDGRDLLAWQQGRGAAFDDADLAAWAVAWPQATVGSVTQVPELPCGSWPALLAGWLSAGRLGEGLGRRQRADAAFVCAGAWSCRANARNA